VPAFLAGCAVLIARHDAVTAVFRSAVVDPRFFLEGRSLLYLPGYVISEAGYAVAKSFNFITIFIIFGLGFLVFRNRTLLKHILFAALPFTVYFLNLGLLTAEHLCLLFPLFCLAAAEGLFIYLAPLSRRIQVVLGAGFMILALIGSYLIWIAPTVAEGEQLKRETDDMAERMTAGAALIAPYHYGAAFWYRHGSDQNIYRLSGMPYRHLMNDPDDPAVLGRLLEGRIWINRGHIPRPEAKILLKEIFRAGKEVVFVDAAYAPSGLRSFFLSRKRLEEINKRKTWLPRMNFDEAGLRIEKMMDSARWPAYRLVTAGKTRIKWDGRLMKDSL
jgi:hypothetical protein